MKIIEGSPGALIGRIAVPGDKSMSHRAVIFGALAEGQTQIYNFLFSDDCLKTVEAFKKLGANIQLKNDYIIVDSEGYKSFQEPNSLIDLGNSGTTARLLLGLLSALPVSVTLTGDKSLQKRPMKRVIDPLSQMGAEFIHQQFRLPITVKGSTLNPIKYELPVDSAQVKSAIILAGLLTNGETVIIEPNRTRDHTERMLPIFNGEISRKGHKIIVKGKQTLTGASIHIPGDFSSAAFWIVGALITPKSELILENVGLNPTRIGLIEVLKRMGANIEINTTHYIGEEPVGTVNVKYSELKPTTVQKEEIPLMIDEVPLLALAATQAEGEMVISNLEELRYKETDRIRAIGEVLTTLGAQIEEGKDYVKIKGKTALNGGEIESYGDHRIAMMGAIASLITNESVSIRQSECINISYPNFFEDFRQLLFKNK